MLSSTSSITHNIPSNSSCSSSEFILYLSKAREIISSMKSGYFDLGFSCISNSRLSNQLINRGDLDAT